MKKDKTQRTSMAHELFLDLLGLLLALVGAISLLVSSDYRLAVDCALGIAIVEMAKVQDAEVSIINRLQKNIHIQAEEICSLQAEVEALKEKKTAKKPVKRQTKSTKTK